MNRDFAKKILAEALDHDDPEMKRDVRGYVNALGEEQTLTLMESFRSILWTPGAFKETERQLEKGINVREAGMGSSATAVFSILGVTSLVQEAYQQPDQTPLDDVIFKVPSKTFAEPKAWMGPPDYPKPLADGEEPDLTRLLMRSVVQPNMDFGLAFSIPRKAIDDDQVGQLAQYPAWMGKQHKRQEEAWAAAALTGEAFTDFGLNIPAVSYLDPDGTSTIYTTSAGDGTRKRTNALNDSAFTGDNLISLYNLMKEITDWAGKILFVTPDLIIGGTAITFKSAQVLNSAFWPGVTNTTGASTGLDVGPMAINPLDPKWKALRAPLDYQEEPFFASAKTKKAWYLIQSGRNGGIGLVKQDRQVLEVLMEAPNAGVSLRTRSYYHRTYRRAAWYVAEARHLGRGSSGSV